MWAVAAAVMFFLYAFGVHPDSVSLVWLGVGFLALHMAWNIALPTGVTRITTRGQ